MQEHLSCGNDGFSQSIAFLNNRFLNERHSFKINLDSEITARNHDSLRSSQNAVDVVDCLRLLDFRHDGKVASVILDDLAANQNVIRGAYETQRNGIDSFFEANHDVFPILLR